MRSVAIAALIIVDIGSLLAQGAKLRGRVVDSSGAVMTGVQVTVYQKQQPAGETRTSGSGEFEIEMAAGEYDVVVVAPGFERYATTVTITPAPVPLTVLLKPAQVTQRVEVIDDPVKVSIDADSSLNTTVLDKEFAEDLPAEADDLTAYLQF